MPSFTLIVARLSLAAVSLTLLCAASASAQRATVGSGERLNFKFEFSQGIDSDLPPELGGAPANGAANHSVFSSLFTAQADYSLTRRRWKVAGGAGAAFRYYQPLDRLDAVGHSGGVGLGIRLPRQGRLEISQAAAFSPSYLYQSVPVIDMPALGAPIALNPEYRIDQTDSYTYTTRVALLFGSPRTTQLTTSGEYRLTEYASGVSTPNLSTRAAGVTVSHALSRTASFSLGYQYRTGDLGYTEPSQEQQAIVGLQYSLALSKSRRLLLSFNAAPSLVSVPASAVGPEETDESLSRLQGDTTITYPFSPDWRVAVTYRRDVQYLPGVTDPLFSDGTHAQLNGLIFDSLDLAASVGSVSSTSVYPGSNTNLDYYTSRVRIGYAVNHSFAVFGEYLYYYYDQSGQRTLAPGLPEVFGQHSARIGVTWSAKALGR